jgi:hypothetical protein
LPAEAVLLETKFAALPDPAQPNGVLPLPRPLPLSFVWTVAIRPELPQVVPPSVVSSSTNWYVSFGCAPLRLMSTVSVAPSQLYLTLPTTG